MAPILDAPALALVWCAIELPAQAPDASDPATAAAWHVVELARGGDLTIRLRVQSTASIVDADWLALEFENGGTEPIVLLFPRYSISASRLDPQTGVVQTSGQMASGNDFDLFPRFWDGPRASPITIAPGIHRVSEHPSLYSAALLGLAPRDGHRVKALMQLTTFVIGHGELATIAEGVPFTFAWVHPGEQGFAVGRARLTELLAQTKWSVPHHYLALTLLAIPEVGGTLSVDDLLAAIDRQAGPWHMREQLVRFLDTRWPGDAKVRAHYRRRLVPADDQVLGELACTTYIWDETFVEPIVKMFEVDPRRHGRALAVLHEHGRPQRDPTLARRLSTALLTTDPFARRELDQVWSFGVRALGLTGDARMVELLRPFLESHARVLPEGNFCRTMQPPGSIPEPVRACDCALDAILTILDGEAANDYPTRARWVASTLAPDNALLEIRDEMIRALKKRLDGMAGNKR